MVRTRSFGVKAGGKSSKKTSASAAPAASAGGSSGSKKNENGNSVQVQPTPAWQREITGFLGNPSKKPRLEDEESNDSTEAAGAGTEKPLEGDVSAGSKVEVDSENVAANSTKDDTSENISKNVTDGNAQESEKKEKDTSGPTEKGSGDGANGCEAKKEAAKEDLPKEKTDSKVVGENGSVSPSLADDQKNIDKSK